MDDDITTNIKDGDNYHLKKILEKDPSVADSKTESGISLLQYAVYCRNKDAIDLIRKFKKTDPDIFEAVCTGDEIVAKKLLEQNPELINTFSADGFTLLGYASYFDQFNLVKLLLEKGANPNTQANNQFRVAPIHSACSISSYEIAELLLKNGADPNAKQLNDYTPLHSTAYNGKNELTKLLIEYGADVSAKADDGKTALAIAIEKGFTEIADLIQNYKKK